MAGPFKVLSIDGGGIRGIIPALLLAEIEKRTGKPIAKLFDLIVGTSTGGILALGLSKPKAKSKRPQYSAAELVGLYREEGPRIFCSPVWHRITAAGNLIDERYPSGGIDGVLKEYFGGVRLKDAVTDVMCSCYDIERRRAFFFKSTSAKKKPLDRNFLMAEVARATSAAPTYFEPAKLVPPGKQDYYAMIDGGVFANNPAMCAYVEALTTFKAKDVLVVSLGTGGLTRRIPYEEATGWGLAMWAVPILDVVFDGVADTVDYQMDTMLPRRPGEPPRYYRFQVRLDEGSDSLDDVSKTNLRVLGLLADDLITERDDDIEELCAQLT